MNKVKLAAETEISEKDQQLGLVLQAMYRLSDTPSKKSPFKEAVVAGPTYDVNFAMFVHGSMFRSPAGKQNKKVKPDTTNLVALLLSAIPEEKREKAIKELVKKFSAAGEVVPTAKSVYLEMADNLISQLTTQVEEPRSGSVNINLETALRLFEDSDELRVAAHKVDTQPVHLR